MKIAWFTPLNAQSTAGQYSAALLTQLSRDHQITLFATGLSEGHRFPTSLPVVNIEGRPTATVVLERVLEHDIVVYNLANHGPRHTDIHKAMQLVPGVTIVHDLNLDDVFCPRARKLSDKERHSLDAERRYSPACSDDEARITSMLRSAVRGSVGIVTHSSWARRAVEEVSSTPVVALDLPRLSEPAPPHTCVTPADGRVRFLTANSTPEDAIDLVIEALGASRPNVLYTVVGELGSQTADIQRRIAFHQLESNVQLHPRPDSALRARLLAEADVLLVPQVEQHGQGLMRVQEALLSGRPTLAWGRPPYSDIPDDVLVKVASISEMSTAIQRLATHHEERAARAERSRAFAEETYQTANYARLLVEFLEECLTSLPVCKLLDRLADYVAELPTTAHIQALSTRLGAEVSALMRAAPRKRAESEAA